MVSDLGGKKYVIGEDDYKIHVHLPPEGQAWNPKTKSLERIDIITRSLLPADQFWERPVPPEDYDERREKEKMMKSIDPDFNDATLAEYKEREWRRRRLGVWFMNNGTMMYLTGTNYIFLTHWVLDGGFPEFRIPDMEFFYAWQFCEENNDVAGLLMLTKRRQGKTAKSGVIMFDRTSQNRKVRGGIQSKTEDDAKDVVFFGGIVQPFIYMIDFFVPVFDKGKVWPPVDKIRFFKSGGRGDKVTYSAPKDTDALMSWIDFKNSKEKAYDGSKLYTYIGDEVAKTTGVDVMKRHMTVRKTLLGRDGFSIIGKALYTTTVEEVDNTSAHFRTLWDESNQNELTKNGRTKSWLYRYFVPAYKTLYVDKYGYADEERARKFLINEREALADNPFAMAHEIRQNPFTWQEAFRSDGDTTLYNPLIIDNRLDYLAYRKGTTFERGTLDWDDAKRIVTFNKNPNGHFYVAQEPITPNNVRWPRATHPTPLGSLRYVIGIDPFDHIRTKAGTFSLGAAAVYRRHDSMDIDGSDNFVCIYLGRPPHPHIFYEDMVKLCHWYGCQMLFEDQKPAIESYFDIDRGYGAFLMRNAKGDPGISASVKTHIDIVEETGMFITKHGHRVMFDAALTQWRDFDVYDTEKYDLAMATGYALIANTRIGRGIEKVLSKKPMNIETIFRKIKLQTSKT